MKLEKNMKLKDFYEYVDIFYQRSHKLRKIWQNEDNEKEYKDKAYKLWSEIFIKIMFLSQVLVEHNKRQGEEINKKFPGGGILVKPNYN